MTEQQIIRDIELRIDLTDAGLIRYMKKIYPDQDGRKFKKWIRQARENCKRSELLVNPPYELSESEMKIWVLTMDLLDRSILQPIDHVVLADYCKEKAMYYDYQEGIKDLDDFGILISKNGAPYQHPLIGMANSKKLICEKTEHKFGFDPSGRRKNGYEKKESKQTTLTSLLAGSKKNKVS